MISHDDHVVDYVDDYMHGVLEPDDAKYVETHCEKCKICRQALEEAEKRHAAIKAVPPVEAPEQLVQNTIDRVNTHAAKRTRLRKTIWRTVMYATAASVLIIGGLNLFYYNLSPSPYDLRLLGQENLLAGSPASLRVSLFDRSTGRPVPNVPIELALLNTETNESIQLATLTTDQQGAAGPNFRLPEWDDGQYTLRVIARTPKVEELTRPVELRRSWKLMLSTDKPVYQPGQTIHLRSLGLRRPDLKPVTGEEVTFSIADPAGNVIFKQPDVMSRFGIASADCPLATEIIEGSYQIECRVGDTTSSRTVEVQKYVLPKFKIDIDLDKPFYQPGNQVTGSVLAKYFFGKPVTGGDVKIEVYAVDVPGPRIAEVTEKTDEEGKVPFRFVLPDYLVGREQDSGAARFRLVATVTDTGGQTQAKAASRVISANPILVQVIPEAGMLVRDVANTIYVYTSYPDGRPASARLVVHGLDQEITTSRLGVASFELTPKEETVGLTVKATDDDGLVGRQHVELSSRAFVGDFLIRADKSVYSGGDTMSLVALGAGVEPVFVDFIKDEQSILSQSIEMADGRGQLDFDLPADVFGTIKMVAYRFGASGLAVRRSRMIYVRQARELDIATTFDHQQYRPGDKAKLRFKLTDSQGNPAPGAISLAAVDEAVFSVLSQATGLAQTFFLLEQELLEPVYAIYDWSPFDDGEIPLADRVTFEQALFSTTARGVQDQVVAPPEPGDFDEPMGGMEPDFAPEMAVADEAWVASPEPLEYDESPFTLTAASYEQNVSDTQLKRHNGLQAITAAWLVLACSLILVSMAAFAVSKPKVFLLTTGIVLLLTVVVALLLPALGVTEDGRPLAAMADFAGAEADEMAFDAVEDTKDAAMDVMDAMPLAPEDAVAMAQTDSPGAAAPPRVREYFPETLLWRPELITDDNGVAQLDVDLADSITTWRLSASAVSGQGDLGSAEFPIRVFQPFFVDLNLPVALTRNDEVAVPVVVYNYLDKSQSVELEFEDAEWFSRIEDADDEAAADDTTLTLELEPGEVRSLSFPIKVLKVGRQQLQVTARGSGMADAVRRMIEVVPDGRKVEEVASGALDEPFEATWTVPDETIEGSAQAIVKLYPSTFSQLVEGLDAIFQMPYGCFEQTSSTTYPNILALDYLRRTKTSAPAIEAKARQYIHVGYQRLVSFEVSGGGFDWFGNPPANQTLTAYGLMEFEDMAQVHDVDPNLIERTRNWLLAQRRGDGSWRNEAGMLNDGLAGSVQRGGDPNLATTAYLAWAVFGGGKAKSEATATLDYLLSHSPSSIEDAYLVAVVCNAIAAIDDQHSKLPSYLARLDSLKKTSDDGKKVWWEQAGGDRTMFYGSGHSGSIETTAMAVLAMTGSSQHAATTRRALTWLVEQKDDRGTWHSTQATVLALKALVAATGTTLAEEKPRQIEIALNGETVRKVDIPTDQADVLQQINLSDLVTDPGQYTLRITDRSAAGTGYQTVFRYHVDEPTVVPEGEALAIDVTYDRTRLEVDDRVICKATIKNNLATTAPMVIVDLPIPGGFVLERGELEELVGSKKIARYQITPRKAILYLRQLTPGAELKLRYRLRATMPVKVAVPPVQAYHYYDPDQRGIGKPAQLEATVGA